MVGVRKSDPRQLSRRCQLASTPVLLALREAQRLSFHQARGAGRKRRECPQGPPQLNLQFCVAPERLDGDAAGLLPGMVATGTTHLTAVMGVTNKLRGGSLDQILQ